MMEHAELGVAIASVEMRRKQTEMSLPADQNVAYPLPSLLVEELAVIEEKLIKRILTSCS